MSNQPTFSIRPRIRRDEFIIYDLIIRLQNLTFTLEFYKTKDERLQIGKNKLPVNSFLLLSGSIQTSTDFRLSEEILYKDNKLTYEVGDEKGNIVFTHDLSDNDLRNTFAIFFKEIDDFISQIQIENCLLKLDMSLHKRLFSEEMIFDKNKAELAQSKRMCEPTVIFQYQNRTTIWDNFGQMCHEQGHDKEIVMVFMQQKLGTRCKIVNDTLEMKGKFIPNYIKMLFNNYK
jgi:hypothetical protein